MNLISAMKTSRAPLDKCMNKKVAPMSKELQKSVEKLGKLQNRIETLSKMKQDGDTIREGLGVSTEFMSLFTKTLIKALIEKCQPEVIDMFVMQQKDAVKKMKLLMKKFDQEMKI